MRRASLAAFPDATTPARDVDARETDVPPPGSIRDVVWSDAWTLVALDRRRRRWRARCCSCLPCARFCRRPVMARRWQARPPSSKASAARLPMTRPPVPGALSGHVTVVDVPAGSPAAAAGLRPGDVVLHARNLLTGRAVDLSSPPRGRRRHHATLARRLPARHARPARVERPPRRWRRPRSARGRAPAGVGAAVDARGFTPSPSTLGPLIEMIAIVGAAVVLLLLRPRDATALLIVSTLALAGTSTGGIVAGGRVGDAGVSGRAAHGVLVAGDAAGLSADRDHDPAISRASRACSSGTPGSTPCPSSSPSRWSFPRSARRCFWQAPTAWRGRPHGTRPTRASSTRRLPAACC